MTQTSTTYQIEAHAYTENTPCDNPEACKKSSHWLSGDCDTTKDLDTAREWASMDDAPAVRIVKIVTTTTREMIA